MQALQRCELYLLKVLCWDLNTVTPMHFVQQHLYQGIVFSNDSALDSTTPDITEKMLLKIKRHTDYFALQVIKQDFMLSKQFSDQVIAASTIYAARKASNILKESWNIQAFKKSFNIESLEEIQECFDLVYSAYDKNHDAKNQAESVKQKTHKVLINFSRVDSENSEPKMIETSRISNNKDVCDKASHGCSDRGVLSTAGNEVSQSEHSGVAHSFNNVLSNEECFS